MLDDIAKLFLGCDWQFGIDDQYDEPMLFASRRINHRVFNYAVEIVTLVEPLPGIKDTLAIARLLRVEACDIVVIETDERRVNGAVEFRRFCEEYYQHIARQYSTGPVSSCGWTQ